MIKAAGYVIVSSEDSPKALVLRNARHGTWAPPKGTLEKEETFEEAAQREFEEEVGYSISSPTVNATVDVKKFWDQNYEKDGVPKISRYYFAVCPKPFEPKISGEHSGFKWVVAGEMATLQPSMPDLSKLIEAALEEIKRG